MKFRIVLLVPFLWTCQTKPNSAEQPSAIHSVESSLCPPVHLVGDPVWTIEDRMKHYGVPGASVAVILDNKVIWSKTYGVMDKETKEPVTSSTLFQAGSVSKPVAAYGALREVQDGKIKLEENVNTYLKSWKLPDNEFTKDRKVTLKGLLSHTAGITVHGFPGYAVGEKVPTVVQVLNGEPPANTLPIRVDKMPGESWRYSGGGYTIMQQMLIDVEGRSFPEVLKQLVLEPTGMTHSTYTQPLPDEQLKLAATGYLPDGTMTPGKRHTYPEMAAAGLWTTAEDLAAFAINIQLSVKGLSNGVLSKESVSQMLTPVMDNYGLGLSINQTDDDVYFSHNGWDEGFCAQMVAHKDKGYGFVVMINANQPDFMDELTRAVALTYHWDNFVPSYQSQPITESISSKAVGRYKNGSDDVLIIYLEGSRLWYKSLYTQPMELFALSDSTFVRHERTARIQLRINPVDGKRNLVYLKSSTDAGQFEQHELLAEGVKVPFEWILAGDFPHALKEYKALQAAHPKDHGIEESVLNINGYDLLGSNKITAAKDMFKINIALYPASANVYDSYAEACLKNGEKELAIINYKKSLQLNPGNKGAKKVLAELERKSK